MSATAIYAGVSIGWMLGRFIYHRWFDDGEPPEAVKPQNVAIPVTNEGAPVPLIYGRCLVRAPVLAWGYVTNLNTDVSANVQLLFVCGIGFDDGNGTNQLHALHIGDKVIASGISQTGNGLEIHNAPDGDITFLSGGPSQIVANDSDTPTSSTYLGRAMLSAGIPHGEIPSYRGFISVFLHQFLSGWLMDQGGAPAYAFEVSSYRDVGSYPAAGVYAQIGADSNPANVIYDILKAKFGKLGISTSLIDFASFQKAGSTLYGESHGYSRAIEDSQSADEILEDVLRQIDGAIDEDPTTGKAVLRLARNDYDPDLVKVVNKHNASKLMSLSLAGWVEIPNKVRVIYTNRSDGYRDGSVTEQNQANAVAQGSDEEHMIEYRGATHESQARALALRELHALSRPIMKFRLIVGREFASLMRLDVIRVQWKNPDIDGMFRIANVERGTLEDGMIALDCISDLFYVWRNNPPQPPAGSDGIDRPLVVNG